MEGSESCQETPSRRCPPEQEERAARVEEICDEHDSEWSAMSKMSRETRMRQRRSGRKGVHQREVDACVRPGTPTEESAEGARSKQENAELRRAKRYPQGSISRYKLKLDRPCR